MGSQLLEMQSAWVLQWWPLAQLLGQGPPQSTSVSGPLKKPSVQVGWQMPSVQSSPRQSPSTKHGRRGRHWYGQWMPQSVKASLPFHTPSLHDGA